MKHINGPITNYSTGESKDIIVKSTLGCKPKDFLLGIGLVTAGIAYLCSKCFKNGALQADISEYETLKDLGLINESNEKAGEDIVGDSIRNF